MSGLPAAFSAPGEAGKTAAGERRYGVSPVLLGLLGICLGGLLIRLWALDQSLFGDELFTLYVVKADTLRELLGRVVDTENTPPLFYLLSWICARVGDPTVTLRLPSLLAGVALIPLCWALARRVFGETAGLLAAGLVAAAPGLVYFSVEARAYMLAGALALAVVLMVCGAGGLRFPGLAGLALITAAALYSQAVVVPVILAAGAWLVVVRPPSWTRTLAALATGMVLFVPWLPFFIRQNEESGQIKLAVLSLLSPVTGRSLWDVPLRAYAGHPFAEVTRVPGLSWWLFLVVAVACLALLVRLAAGVSIGPRVRQQLLLVVLAALALPVGALILALATQQSIWNPRNLLASVPFGLILLAVAMASVPARWRVALAIGCLVPFLVSDVHMLTDVKRPRQREAAAYAGSLMDRGVFVVTTPTLGIPGPLRDEITSYLESNPGYRGDYAVASDPAQLGVAVARVSPRRPIAVVGFYANGFPTVTPIGDRPLLYQRSWPGLQTVFVRVYGPSP